MNEQELKDYVEKFLSGVRRFYTKNYPDIEIVSMRLTKYHVSVVMENGLKYGFNVFDQNICDYFDLSESSIEGLIKIIEDEMTRQNP